MGLYNNNNGSLDLLAGSTVYADMPVGTWIKWDDQDNLPTGFLKYGDTITQIDYPELYAMYGSTVPYKADTSELGEIETYTLSLSSASPNVCQYDGFISLGYLGAVNSSPQYLTVWVNSSGLYNIHHANAGQERGMMTIPVKKGDTVYGNNSYDMNSARWYKKSLIVKAKQIALPTDFEDAVDDKFTQANATLKDSTPTQNSNKPITSGGVYEALQGQKIKVFQKSYNLSAGSRTDNWITLEGNISTAINDGSIFFLNATLATWSGINSTVMSIACNGVQCYLNVPNSFTPASGQQVTVRYTYIKK